MSRGTSRITPGYLYMSAKSGGIISSFRRIIFASILGVVIFQDPMNMGVIFGGLLIAISIIGVTLFQRGQAKKEKAEIGAEG